MSQDKIDKFGLCPNCKTDWRSKDIHEELNSLSIFTHKTPKEMLGLANNYGWTEHNRGIFSKVIVRQLEDGRTFYICPNIRCGRVYDAETGIDYDSVEEASRIRPNVSDKVEMIDLSEDRVYNKHADEEVVRIHEDELEIERLKELELHNEEEEDLEEEDEIDGGEFDDIDKFNKFFKKK